MLFTLKQCVDFCYDNQIRYSKNGKFVARQWLEWAHIITEAAEDGNLEVCQDDSGLCGIMIRKIRYASKTIFIEELVAKRRGLATFVSLLQNFPEYKIECFRLKHNEKRIYTKEDLWVVINRRVSPNQPAKC